MRTNVTHDKLLDRICANGGEQANTPLRKVLQIKDDAETISGGVQELLYVSTEIICQDIDECWLHRLYRRVLVVNKHYAGCLGALCSRDRYPEKRPVGTERSRPVNFQVVLQSSCKQPRAGPIWIQPVQQGVPLVPKPMYSS